MKKTVIMSKNALLKEHKSLIKILRYGTHQQQVKEAKAQAKEAKAYK
tara:strand:- start:86 stop:226 length:141 start_codon:yes stop_codon:yes gene_type:complete